MPDKSDSDPRCSWCHGSELYRRYHDEEWGRPERERDALFELISLEGAQAGLSWITILKKREGYRELFAGFEPERVAGFSDRKLAKIAANPAIVRHRQKVDSVRTNARAILAMEAAGDSFAGFIWSFVDDEPMQNRFRTLAEVPAVTDLSTTMSRTLKARGFAFVGPTTCYAFMQAAGLVNDHLVGCPVHAACEASGSGEGQQGSGCK
ncbi:MAG: DNA-3-methyladenine glycosylase I [Gammaproteobacteria bacterium]|nr:MAG: DNA-3-methyladenine glycosylase I [Gammaproteobacteria bacterium]